MNTSKECTFSSQTNSYERHFSESQYKTPTKIEKSQILELTIDLTNPSKDITQNKYEEFVFSLSKPHKKGFDQPLSQQISPQKILAKPQTRNYKKNTFDHELEIFSAYENPGKIIFTDPSFTLQNQKKNRKNQTKLTNPIYNLDEEIKAHSKAMLEQNFSTGFTPNSKQTEEDFDSDDIGEGGSIDKNYKNTCKVLIKKTPNLADSDAISQFTELSKNVKYVDGGVGVVECNSFNRLFNEKKSELDSSGGGTLKKNRIKSPFFPMLLIQTNNQKICPGNSKFSAFLNSLSKDLK